MMAMLVSIETVSELNHPRLFTLKDRTHVYISVLLSQTCVGIFPRTEFRKGKFRKSAFIFAIRVSTCLSETAPNLRICD
jgi:hypothetical protein